MKSTQIKVRKELTAIETFDGVVYTQATPSELDRLVENSKFIVIGTKRLAVHQIKSYDKSKINEMDFFIASQPKHIQQIINDRNEDKYKKVGKRLENIEEIVRYLSSKGIEGFIQEK